MMLEPVRHAYDTQIKWTSEKKGILSCDGKPDLMVACPPEFGGHPDIWSPEDLFVGATELCLLTTFLWLLSKEKISIISYESHAHGILELGNSKPRFTTIDVNIDVKINSESDKAKINQVFEKLKTSCLISNSINTEVNIHYKIKVGAE